LLVKRGVCKEVDLLLGDLKVGGCTKLFSEVGFKLFKAADRNWGHVRVLKGITNSKVGKSKDPNFSMVKKVSSSYTQGPKGINFLQNDA
jgi:hypothetical protein